MRVAIIGEVSADERDALETCVGRAGAHLRFLRPDDSARDALLLDDPPGCVLLGPDADAKAFIGWIRDQPAFFDLPVMVLVPYPTDALFRQAYAVGANEVLLAGDAGGVMRRLANIVAHKPMARPPADKGLAVVASAEISRRRLFGRTLRQAGFDVGFAADQAELTEAAGGANCPSLVVATPSFPPGGAQAAIESARAAAGNPELAAIVLPSFTDRTGSAALPEDADPTSKLLFFADELLKGNGKELRGSRRLLHATLCAFRRAGSLDPIFGLTHNISRAGLYVRTLDPPSPGAELWFEMRAPSSEIAIHLRGRVMWRRDVSHLGGAAPPGFGMRVEAELCPGRDLAAYEMAYDELVEKASGHQDTGT